MDVDGLDGGRLGVVGIFRGVFAGRVSGCVILWDIIVNKGFCIEFGDVDRRFCQDGIGHEACLE
jgi:hypothetical protein